MLLLIGLLLEIIHPWLVEQSQNQVQGEKLFNSPIRYGIGLMLEL